MSYSYQALVKRWTKNQNRDQHSPEYRDEWYGQQCLHCRHFIPLTGPAGADFGACSNVASTFDKCVMFEHDGCDEFEGR